MAVTLSLLSYKEHYDDRGWPIKKIAGLRGSRKTDLQRVTVVHRGHLPPDGNDDDDAPIS